MNRADTIIRTNRINGLRRRFIDNGLVGLDKGEALELILSYSGLKDVAGVAERLKRGKAGFRAVFDSQDEVVKGGVLVVKVVKALAARYLKERLVGADVSVRPQLLNDYLLLTLSGERVEKFVAVFLDAASAVIDVDTLHEGTINTTAVYPRVCVEAALRRKARVLVFAHNHPSGDALPSAQDRILMGYLDRAAGAVGLDVYDHLIVGRTKVFSLRREGGWQMERTTEAKKTQARLLSERREDK